MKNSAKNNRNNKKVKTVKFLYFEKQKPFIHAEYMLSTMFLEDQFSLKKNTVTIVDQFRFEVRLLCFSFLVSRFLEYCDEFDRQNHCSRSRESFFIHFNNNIISFILKKFHIQSSYNAPDDPLDLE
jgi:hypothetical protein